MDLKFRVYNKASGIYLDGPLLNINCLDGCVYSYIDSGYAKDFYKHSDNLLVEQYIGKNDIKGQPIYEGDIIKGDLFDSRLPTLGYVVYDNEHCAFANKNLGGNTPLYKINNIVIIGNIHDEYEEFSELKEENNDDYNWVYNYSSTNR